MTALAGVAGKRVVITGGGGGLGAVMVAELARLGASVVATGRTHETLAAAVAVVDDELGAGHAFAVTSDIRDPASIAAMADEAERLMGGIDGLVNNASGLFPVRAEKLSPNGFRAVTDIVLQGTFNCTREFGVRWLDAGRPGAVVSVLTPYAWMGGPGIVHTAAAKGGVLAMTKTLGVEWAGRGVRVNAIAPGWMPVGGTSSMVRSEDNEQRLLRAIPAGRLLRGEETARAVAYLISDDAAYITGHCLTIDGGHHLSKGLFEFVEELPER